MDLAHLRIALFSGNYNMTVDGANKALNRLVGWLERHGAAVHVYSPTVPDPAFAPQGELVSVPSVPIPGRSEYRIPLLLSGPAKRDLERFAPDIVHVSSPDIVAHRALGWARGRGLATVASVHTLFETYPVYYGLPWLERPIAHLLRNFYRRCDALLAPTEAIRQEYLARGMNADIAIWARGVDRALFTPGRRDMDWRRAQGIADDSLTIGFLGRLVKEKGLEEFARIVALLDERGVAHEVLIVGEGPAQEGFAAQLPNAHFTGFLGGEDLARALASMDVLLNPSITESFGNVTLEALASGVPVIAADSTGASSIVVDGETGFLVPPGNITAYADRIARYAYDQALRQTHGDAGIRRAATYDWDAINQVVADTYLRLIASRRAAG